MINRLIDRIFCAASYVCGTRAARSKKSPGGTVADGNKSLTGAGAIKSNSDDEICDVTDDVSECQAEALPLVSERPIRAAAVIQRRQIAVGDLWSYVADKKLSPTDSLKDEYDVSLHCFYFLVSITSISHSLLPKCYFKQLFQS